MPQANLRDYRAYRTGFSLHRPIYFNGYDTQENCTGSTLVRLQSQALKLGNTGPKVVFAAPVTLRYNPYLHSDVSDLHRSPALLHRPKSPPSLRGHVLGPRSTPQFPHTTQVLLGMEAIIFSQTFLWPSPPVSDSQMLIILFP